MKKSTIIIALLAIAGVFFLSSCDPDKSDIVYSFVNVSDSTDVTQEFNAAYGNLMREYIEKTGGERFDEQTLTYIFYGTREKCDKAVTDAAKEYMSAIENKIGTGSKYVEFNMTTKVFLDTFDSEGVLIYSQALK